MLTKNKIITLRLFCFCSVLGQNEDWIDFCGHHFRHGDVIGTYSLRDGIWSIWTCWIW